MIGIKRKLKVAVLAAAPIAVGLAGTVSATTDLSGTTDLMTSMVQHAIIMGVVGAIIGVLNGLKKWIS